ncbi:hypothetical protein DFP73DRAFT_567806 [Morchella snyderi]|nr:hypothetical protein DFP73DRAFT_567806 [Morchella snyderi]
MISNQSLPEHEDENSTLQDGDPVVPAPALPVMPGPSVNKKVVKVSSSEDYSCGISCGGKFISGEHQCVYSTDKPLAIMCTRGNQMYFYKYICRGLRFKTRNGFNRHFRTQHLRGDARLENMFSCPFPGCPRTGVKRFNRYDNLLQHRRNIHNENIPKAHVTPRMKAPKPYARKTANPNDAGPSNASN